ncbi:MAG: hypothetical protein WBC04_07200 [Candidatus Acidiferrales bacterium]|jgi:predicted lipid-binding transport protein (Tim44 family)
MTRTQITLVTGPALEIMGSPRPPRRFSRLKAALAALLVTSVAIGLILAALVLGSIIAAVILIVVAIALVLFSIKRFFRLPRRRIDPRY